MQLGNMLKSKNFWIDGSPSGKGEYSDVVISSRIRLARNILGYPFPHKADIEICKTVIEKTLNTIKEIKEIVEPRIIDIFQLDRIDKKFLVERHIVSHQFASNDIPSHVIISEDQSISIMINEEDHLRIQVLKTGLDFKNIWDSLNKIDDTLSAYLDIAYSDDFGYLTACPTNTGTGLRASCLMHFPGLALTNELDKVLSNLSRLGISARGLYGEGTKFIGDIFQVSNSFTLGQSEEEIIDNIERIVKRFISYERNAREKILKSNRPKIEDKVYRAWAILSQARSIDFEETMSFLSMVRVGFYLGMSLQIDISKINELMLITQPSHLQEIAGKQLPANKRDVYRAKILRKYMESNSVVDLLGKK